jgi:CHAT domain-containing protein
VLEIFPGRELVNQHFVAETFELELKQRPFDIVHLASHGEFSTDSSESFLLTYDGKISMDRLARLVGKTRFRSRGLELLTLSACETAAGDDRAALGLAGVALQAGARSALATLWAVNDEVSAQLMIDFYRQLKDSQQSRAEALQQAQVKVLQQRAYRHPAYWAPYLLIGSWL